VFESLVVPKNYKKHWTNNLGWQMAKFFHQEVLKATKMASGGYT